MQTILALAHRCKGRVGAVLFTTPNAVLALVFAALVCGTLGYQRFVVAPREEALAAYQAAYEAAAANVTSDSVTALFGQWRRTTSDGGLALDWSGATSVPIWVKHYPAQRQRVGETRPDTWIVWARSAGDRYYGVEFDLDEKLKLQARSGPIETSLAALMEGLVSAGETAIIDKHKLPREGA